MPSDSWQRLIVRRIVIGPVLWVGGGFFFLSETAAARLLRLCVPSGDLLAAYGLVHQRLGSGNGERKTWLTRPMAFEPLPASVLFGLLELGHIRFHGILVPFLISRSIIRCSCSIRSFWRSNVSIK